VEIKTLIRTQNLRGMETSSNRGIGQNMIQLLADAGEL
jgi:hypothetical protein